MSDKNADVDVEFAGPPPSAHAPGRHQVVAAELVARPGEWAVVGRYASTGGAGSTAHAIRTGKLSAYEPNGAFEAMSRTVDGEHRVYARYVGGEK